MIYKSIGRCIVNIKLMVLIIGLILLIGTASATDYYVNNSWSGASDSNTGASDTNTTAWLTIQKAADTMTAGDTVYVQSGTYNEQVSTVNSGTIANPISFIGEGMPIVNSSTIWEDDGVFHIDEDNITIYGFNISAYNGCGIYAKYNSDAKNLNISNNYITTDGSRGIYFHSNAGNHSLIYNNEIHTDYKEGILMYGGSHTDIEVSYNTIYADENFKHQNAVGSGISASDWSSGLISYINVHHNKVWCASYTGIKIGAYFNHSGNCTISYNEIGPNGYVHNAIELSMDDSDIIGNYIHDTNDTWALYTNALYCPGTQWDQRLVIQDNRVVNATGRALTVGGHQSDILIENFTATNFTGIGIEVFGFEDPGYPLVQYTSDDIMFVNTSLINIAGAAEHPITVLSMGTRINGTNFSWDDVTFLNLFTNGTYAQTTWWLTTQVSYEVNHHFEGTVHAINSNKDDVYFSQATIDPGTFDGEIIFYYYADVHVIDTSGNLIDGATVSFTCNNSSVYARNVNYTYEDFPGTTQNINSTITEANGHIPNSTSNDSGTIVITDFRENLTSTEYFKWNISVSKDGYDTNSTVINVDNSWYRDTPESYQNTTTIILSGVGTPIPINLSCTSDNDWINHTWEAGVGNITNSYNVSVNNIDYNGTINFSYNHTGLSDGNWSNITIYGWNSTYNEISSGSVSQNIQISIWSQDLNSTYDGQTCTYYTDGSRSCTIALEIDKVVFINNIYPVPS